MLTTEITHGTKLELGCGPSKQDGYVGVDNAEYPGVDIVGDALEVLQGLPDGSLEEIYSAHFLEHVDDLDAYMAEMTRVLQPGGRLVIVVPHFANPYFYSDPTHRRAWGLYTPAYYTSHHPWKRPVPVYGSGLPLRLDRTRLVFRSLRPFYVRYAWRKLIEPIANLTRGLQEFYEENLTGLVGPYEIRFDLTKIDQQ